MVISELPLPAAVPVPLQVLRNDGWLTPMRKGMDSDFCRMSGYL